jgi:hypothetical protein
MKQSCLPFRGFDQTAIESDGLAHAGNLWQVATGVKFLVTRSEMVSWPYGKDGENTARVNRISEPPSTGTGDKQDGETRHDLIHVRPIETKSPGA